MKKKLPKIYYEKELINTVSHCREYYQSTLSTHSNATHADKVKLFDEAIAQYELEHHYIYYCIQNSLNATVSFCRSWMTSSIKQDPESHARSDKPEHRMSLHQLDKHKI